MRLQSCLALILLAGTLPASAEQNYKAAAVVFQNAQMYPKSALEDIAQMHIGTSFTATDLGNAAQRLIDTGYFLDVGATLSGQLDAATVIFTTQPLPQGDMIHVSFENFIWLSNEEILAAIRKKALLFDGYVVESSPLVSSFDQALRDALAAKGVHATVTHETFEPTMVCPERVLEYRIAKPTVRVKDVKLSGVDPGLAPLLQKSVNNSVKFSYNVGLAGQTTAEAILSPLLDDGYAKALLSDISLNTALTPDEASVVMSANLSAGQVYRVSSVSFAGAPLLSSDEFSKSARLHLGDIASRELLLETLAPLDSAYRRQGYMDVVIKTNPKFDDDAHTVSYNITVVPGEQYRIHEITINNLDSAAVADFNRLFPMIKGELYNPAYVKDFLQSNSDVKSLAPYVATYKAYADPNTRTVDLVLTFVGRPNG